ncbi:MAG: alpha-L-rhamnosidase [Prevotella sp.]|nr:alpha-L-rhamnosidase [Prevotella sp.]
MYIRSISIAFAVAMTVTACVANKKALNDEKPVNDHEIVSEYVAPTRIVLTKGDVTNAEHLLEPYSGQVAVGEPSTTLFSPHSSILLDFGEELQGGIEITRAISDNHSAARFRLCLGESVSEALSNIDAKETTATNDHSVRDLEISVPWLGSMQIGNSGFRFARLDLLDDDMQVPIVAVRAISRYRDIPQTGAFKCSDERLNTIWQTGARTVHLCMQDYLWDGIKRDRLVWLGDMHPEVMTVNTVFGNHEVVRKSLDYARNITPPTEWMNGICSYSLWWIIIHHHLYEWYADRDYLAQQHDYLASLVHTVIDNIKDGRESYSSGRFIDWPSADLPDVIHAGLQALTHRALAAAEDIARWLGDDALRDECHSALEQVSGHVPSHTNNGQAAALLALEGMIDAEEAAKVITDGGPEKFTSFMGYYLLEALAAAGRYDDALQLISTYWGRMIDLGATTFWEDFNYADSRNAARIDEVVPEGKFDIHADGGAYCYVGLRHSFCHGWASGPTAWLSRHVLGIEPLDIGFRKVRINPHLGGLSWAEGALPTPYGIIKVRHTKRTDGTIESKVELPRGVKRVK